MTAPRVGTVIHAGVDAQLSPLVGGEARIDGIGQRVRHPCGFNPRDEVCG